MKKIILAALAALAIAAAPARAETSVTVTKFHQSYPYSGKATVEYTVGGTLPANAVAEISLRTDDASATFTQSSVVAGANTNVIDFASSFGGALVLTNASFTVTITGNFGGVQLWENGPYWAECNVGASAPEESGYYFWWGDTVGYTRSGGTLLPGIYYFGMTWVSSTGQQMGSSPFLESSCPTYNKNNSALLSEGYIDSTGNLVAAHDAATAHLGAPWRMPTSDEIEALVENCTTEWITTNGVSGCLVTGKGDYANRSIFLPAAGYGNGSYIFYPDSYGYHWCSTPISNDSRIASDFFYSSDLRQTDNFRYYGQSVRPVQGFAPLSLCDTIGVVTRDPAPIVIASVADWDALSAAVAGGLETEEAVVLLACDVGPVATTVGTAEHPFAGVFDGGSNTLTVALSGSDRAIAPFSAISGATIRNLKVEGTVSCAIHCSGLVGEVFGGPNLIEGCEVAAAITCSASHFGGIVGHGITYAVTLRGCVFSGRLSGGTYVATFNGWSDDGAETTLVDCLDASASRQPIGRGEGTVCVSNTYYLTAKNFNNGERLWSEGKRGKRAYSVTGGEGVVLDFGEPLRTYGGSGLAVHSDGLARGGAFYAEAGASILLQPRFTGTPPAGMKHDAFAASAGELAQNGDAWVLAMPAGDVVITATFAEATAYELWAAANGLGAWNETDALGVANVFRYAFDKPTGAFENPPLLDIAIEGGNAIVKTPPVANTAGFAVSVVESGDVAGAAVTARKPLDATGRTVFPMGSATSRFYRLSATEGAPDIGGVQLWEGGPYWAECNVGASEPEGYGYYFWWGDTVGYTRSGGTWTDDYYYDGVTWVSSTGQSMDSSPFSDSSCPTYDKDDSTLQSEGWIDATGNLVAAHDAATAHLGAPWRMPTDAEYGDLVNNCDWTWTTKNGVYGRLVTGKGAYADRSIFLPAVGLGSDSYLYYPGSYGYYWSSTPDSDGASWYFFFYSGFFDRYVFNRYYGQSVRPVRDAD